jgi:hypothetical protein
MQQEMHRGECENSGRNIIEDDSGAFWKLLQLPHRRRLDDIECSKKYKTREQSLPRQRDGDEGDELSGDFVDDDELGIFGGRGAGYAGGGGDADQRDQQGQSDG